MMNQPMPQMREYAHRLLACEAASGKASESKAHAVFRVCEKLRQPLCTLAGVEGFRSLLARALTLAKAEVPSLAAVEINADGSLAGWDSVEAQQHLNEPGVCAEILLAIAHHLHWTTPDGAPRDGYLAGGALRGHWL